MNAKRLIQGLLAILLLAAMELSAQTFNVIYTFTNSPLPGNSSSSLVLDNNTLYGTTYNNGTSSNGTVFKINTDGSGYSVLKSFSAKSASYPYTNNDGAWPSAALVLSGDTLFGTTSSGGTNGTGTIFKISTNGNNFAVLKSFSTLNGSNINSDGANPQSTVVLVGNMLYGTARNGGTNGTGTIFSINTNGSSFTVLKSFSGSVVTPSSPSDGAYPWDLVFSGDSLFGATSYGGSFGYGTVFVINTNGGGYTLLKSFPARIGSTNHDGALPSAGLKLNGSTLYGMANGGAYGWGVVFKVTTNGDDYTVLKSFANIPDGAYPESVLALNGKTLYGTTGSGGISGNGTAFKVGTDGTGFTILKNFSATISNTNNDGALPYSGLVLSGSTLYGTTTSGGSYGSGSVFSLDLPIPLNLQTISNAIVLDWTDSTFVLQAAPAVTGTYTNIPNAASPYTNAITGTQQFFRLVLP